MFQDDRIVIEPREAKPQGLQVKQYRQTKGGNQRKEGDALCHQGDLLAAAQPETLIGPLAIRLEAASKR